MPEVQILLTGLAIGESPRWHEDRLWFCHWGAQEIVAVDLDGNSEVVTHATTNIGYSIDWLPDGRLLVSGQEGLLVRSEPNGPFSIYADLRGLSRYGWSEIVVDGRGNAYANSIGFDFSAFREGRAEFAPGIIALVTPDGSVRPATTPALSTRPSRPAMATSLVRATTASARNTGSVGINVWMSLDTY